MGTLCRLCERLPGCPHLERNGVFLSKKVIEEGNQTVCPDFLQMGEEEANFRERMYGSLGLAYIKALQLLPREPLKDTGGDEMIEVPDFAGMIREGMSIEERTDQLLYETDEDGNFVEDKKGQRIPRGELPVRKYVSEPGSPFPEEEWDTIKFEDFDKLLKALLRHEKRVYGVGKSSKTTKKAKGKRTMGIKPVLKLRSEANKTSKKTKVSKKTETAKKTTSGKVAKPATAKKRVGRKAAAEVKEDIPSAAAEGISIKDVEAVVTKVVNAKVGKLEKLLEELVGQPHNGRSIQESIRDGLTLLHDVTHQTNTALFYGIMGALAEDPSDLDDVKMHVLDPADPRATEGCLLTGKDPKDLFSYYLDSDGEEADEEDYEDDDGEEEDEEDTEE